MSKLKTKTELWFERDAKGLGMTKTEMFEQATLALKNYDFKTPAARKYYETFLSMVVSNGGKYACPFNSAYLSVTPKQLAYLDSLCGKMNAYNGEGIRSGGMFYFPESRKLFNLTYYEPKNNQNKAYIGFFIEQGY